MTKTGQAALAIWAVVAGMCGLTVLEDRTLSDEDRFRASQNRDRIEAQRRATERANIESAAKRSGIARSGSTASTSSTIQTALSGSVLEGHVVRSEGYYGTLDVTSDQTFTIAWEAAGCDAQRANLSVLFRKWRYRYGEEAHTVVIRSYTGREIGRVKRSLWSGLQYHCE